MRSLAPSLQWKTKNISLWSESIWCFVCLRFIVTKITNNFFLTKSERKVMALWCRWVWGRRFPVIPGVLEIFFIHNISSPLRMRSLPPCFHSGKTRNVPRWSKSSMTLERSTRSSDLPRAQERTLRLIIVVSGSGVSFTRRPGDTYYRNDP